MLGLLKKISRSFLALFAITLTTILALSFTILTDSVSSNNEIYLTTLIAVGISAGLSILLIFLYYLTATVTSKLLKLVMAWITMRTIKSAVGSQSGIVQASGIASMESDVSIGLSVGSQNGAFQGQKFVVFNTTNQEKWGVLEVIEVRECSCVCLVFDRTNTEFWNDLERRMQYDPSPPKGVSIRMEIPEEVIYDWLPKLLISWRG